MGLLGGKYTSDKKVEEAPERAISKSLAVNIHVKLNGKLFLKGRCGQHTFMAAQNVIFSFYYNSTKNFQKLLMCKFISSI